MRRVHWRDGAVVVFCSRTSRTLWHYSRKFARRMLPPGNLFYFFVGAPGAGAGAGLNPELMLRAPSDTPNSRQRLLTH